MGIEKRRRVLVVDDERDVCEAIAEELSDYEIEVAHSFKEADEKLSGGHYDVVVLDIMGVQGHELLDLYGRKFPCVMLTAHALTVAALERSVDGHARLFLPKHELARLSECVAAVLKDPHPLWSWLIDKFDVPRTFGPEFMAANLLRRVREVEAREKAKALAESEEK